MAGTITLPGYWIPAQYLFNLGLTRATAELMKRLYTGLFRGGQRPVAALRAAQVSMWKEKSWQSPYFWAAFVLQGEWR